jgi:hypothetical protein
MKRDTFYFSHDFNVRNDIKIKRLISKCGYAGYGIFWAIIEDLYNNANALPTDYDCIAFDMRVEKSMVESIVNDFDLFVFDGNKFGSLSIQRRLDERNEKSKKAQISANIRWSDANAMRTHTERNAKSENRNAIKERKGKEIKVKEIKVNTVIPEVKQLRVDCKRVFMDFYLQSKNTEYYWTAKDASNLIPLLAKIESKVKERYPNGYGFEKLTEAFSVIIGSITDPWVMDNLSVPIVNSKFNEIFTQIKNGKQTSKSKYEQSEFRN